MCCGRQAKYTFGSGNSFFIMFNVDNRDTYQNNVESSSVVVEVYGAEFFVICMTVGHLVTGLRGL